jgi:hypothetical protein
MVAAQTKGTLIIYGAIFGCLGFFVVIFGIGFNTLRFHLVHKQGMEMGRNDPDVIELFGSPLRSGLFVPGDEGFQGEQSEPAVDSSPQTPPPEKPVEEPTEVIE